MRSLINRRLFVFIAVFIITLPAFFALLQPGYYNMHDDMQVIRQLEMEKCLQDGQIPCRWTPDLGYGYGYPLFNFYPPLPYYFGQIFRFFGFSFLSSVKLTAVLQIFLSALFIYYLAKDIFRKRLAGIFAAIFYTYAPYHAVNIYVRGAMNEAWAAVFFPLIFLFTRRLILKPSYKYLVLFSLSFAGLLLSHNPMVLTFTPFVLVWGLFWLFHVYRKFPSKFIDRLKTISFYSLGSAALSLLLTSYFTLPLLFETKLVQIDSMFNGYYNYSVHFVSLFQLFISNFWGDGPSVWGTADQMPFMIGYLHWFIPITLFFYTAYRFIRHRHLSSRAFIFIILTALGFIAAFMTHQRSTFIWQIFTPVQKIQFPWRFLSHTNFFLSLSAAYLSVVLLKIINIKVKYLVIVSVILATFISNLSYFHPLKSGPITDTQKFSGQAWTNLITSGIYDYLPKTAQKAALSPAKEFIDAINPAETEYAISGPKKGTDWQFFNIHLNNAAVITLPQLAFPNFKIYDYDQNIPYSIEPEFGRMQIKLSAGDHQIYYRLYNTPIRTIGNYLSLFAWLFIITYSFHRLWRKLIWKK